MSATGVRGSSASGADEAPPRIEQQGVIRCIEPHEFDEEVRVRHATLAGQQHARSAEALRQRIAEHASYRVRHALCPFSFVGYNERVPLSAEHD
jgi:hypothetical protein